jgi:hypothetical protein
MNSQPSKSFQQQQIMKRRQQHHASTEQTIITLASGNVRVVDYHVGYPVLGLDADGRVVVDLDTDCGGGHFGLTLCCDAFDKGVEDGVVCRACYDGWDIGMYDAVVVDPATNVTMK